MVTLGFGFKTYLAYKWRLVNMIIKFDCHSVKKLIFHFVRLNSGNSAKCGKSMKLMFNWLIKHYQLKYNKKRKRKGWVMRKVNFSLFPVDRIFLLFYIRHRFFLLVGTFSENYEEGLTSNIDGSCSSSSLSNIGQTSTSNILPINPTVINSQTQSNPSNPSSICTVSKRSSKMNHSDSSLSSNSLVQTATVRNQNKIQATTITAILPTVNGHDDGTSTNKQQKKKQQQPKSTNAQLSLTTVTQSRRQTKKQEQIQETSRDSSSSHVNGFGTASPFENSDIEKE